ncbi:retrovirus-related pol polyprotein from transposon TNT 1-94 [Tanacetum coccineum]
MLHVEPIPLRNRNNREVHLDYLKHLKESVETLREIVEEAKELLEYTIGTCPKDVNKQDNKRATTLSTRKKQVTFVDQCATSTSNTYKHVEQLNFQKTNVHVPPSTGVNSCTDASGLQPRSNTKKNRILSAKSVNMKKVEDHPRTIMSSLKTTDRVDSSISSKRTVVQIVLWYLDSGCLKDMTEDHSRLMNFMKKFIETVRFGNDHFRAIMGYGDYVIGDSVISKVYYVEGMGHNLFSVGQFCDSDLEVAFRKHSCYVRDSDGVELIKGSCGSNLYTISVKDMMKSSPICLLSKASKNKSWSWHRRLNHLNFGIINDLARKDLVRGLPRLKFEKDHICLACQIGKSKKHTYKPKPKNTNLEVLNTLHMDLCGPMHVQIINGKKYILIIVDDYSRFTWVKFLRLKDETPEVVTKFLKQIQVGLNKIVRYIRTDNGTEFVNKDLTKYYERDGIFHQKTVPRTPQQNGVVERRNRTLVEAARTMLIFSKAPMFLWAEAVATACYTQNRSLIYTRHNKTPYELVHNKKPDLTFFCVFGALCYPTNDSEDLGKLQPTTDIGIFVGYALSRKGPAPTFLTSGQISSGLVPNPVPAAPYVPPQLKTWRFYSNQYTMANVNVNAPAKQAPVVAPPTRTDDQILPRSSWVPVGKSNCYLNVEKSQSNPIYKIVVDILKHTNFFRAFTASSTISSIYIQQFWDTIQYVKNTGSYSCQLDEQCRGEHLQQSLICVLRERLQGLKDQGPSDIMSTRTSVVKRAHIDYRGVCGKNSLQSIHTYIEDKKNRAQHTQGKKKALLMLSQVFSAKGTKREVFGMPIPNNLIVADIQGEQYYNAYLKKVRGKGKEKVSEEQAAQVLLNLQTPKKKSPADQYIFQRHSFAPTEPSGHDESSSLYAELGLTDSETESDEEVPEIDVGDQDEGQAGPNPGIQDEGHTGSNPGDDAVSQPQPSHVVHAGPNLEHIDVEITDTSIQQNPKKMDEEFTTTAYPNVQENLKLPTEGQVRFEEPTNSVGTYLIYKILTRNLASPISSLRRSHRKTNLRKPILNRSTKKKKRRHESPKTPPGSPPHQPPPPPPPVGPSRTLGASGASRLSQLPLPPPTLSTNQSEFEDRPATPEPVWSIPSSDMHVITHNWASALASTYAPPPENSLLA